MGKNVGLTYVKDFTFPAEQGFTGSAGVHKVRGYMRGGHVKSPDTTKGKGKSRAGMPKNVKAKGGVVNAGEGGYFGKPGDKYPNKGAHQTMPKNVKAKGGSVHDKLYKEGGKMGYAQGGQVKPSNTSGEFKAKRHKQDTMDTGVQPARRGRTQQEIEAGGTKRLKPGLAKGGGVHKVRLHKSASRRAVGTTRSARGGLARAAGDKKTHPTGRGRKPFTGYNEQPGGSKIEDARYMKGKK